MNKSGHFLHSPHGQFLLNFKLDKSMVLSCTLDDIGTAAMLETWAKKVKFLLLSSFRT